MLYREVFNEDTGMFRVEQKGLLGWSFVTDPATNDYLNFSSHEEAQKWICEKMDYKKNNDRRWKVVNSCSSSTDLKIHGVQV